MTHFNHDWDTTKTPAVPVSIGDRYYAQDLNDDFNYLKHLPYEVFLQGRSSGVMVAPNDTWNNNTNTLTLSGGFGVISQDCIELDPNEGFTIPPKTHSSPRYERVSFVDTTLVLPSDADKAYYIVATPTKRSLLQRAKTLFTEQYASRVRHDGIITIQDTAPTVGQILIGLCCYKQYCLLVDNNPDQCKDNIVLKKWFGQEKITQDFVPALQAYYNTSIDSIKTEISINTVNGGYGIDGGTYNNCSIKIGTVNGGIGVSDGTFNNCSITIGTVSGGGIGVNDDTYNNCTITISIINGGYGVYDDATCNSCIITIGTVNRSSSGIHNGTFNNCTITINTVSGGYGSYGGTYNDCNITIGTVSGISYGINGATCNSCTITIDTVSGGGNSVYRGTYSNCSISIGIVNSNSYGTSGSTYNDCSISIDAINGSGSGIHNGTFNNCTITIGTVNGGYGISGGTYNDCSITIGTVNGGYGIRNITSVAFYLTRIGCTAVTDLSNTNGKLNVLNDTVFHAS